ncbi:MAG: hypothetical protein D6750_09535 [Bacteroidetes bacterium]|nr:MAG: hypothetical protein D6750_09535 [Bacteroidota bacterium]
MRWIKKRKSTPVVFGNTVDDEAILRQKQIEEPEGEVDFSFLSGRTTTPGGIRPTGKRSLGVSGAYAPLDHEHPTALLLTSNTQSPEQRELRIDNANFLRIWDGNQWVLVEPTASNQAPLLTGTQNVGTSLKYSREDHTHPTGLLQVSNTQTPITGEIRYDSEGIKRFDGTNWILIADLTTSLDWSNITNKPTEFPVSVRKNSAAPVHTRPRLNFIEGSNITITIADDTTDNEVDITISSTGGGGSGDAYSTVSDGTNTASATGQEVLRFISPDGTVNIQVVAGSPDEVRFTVGSHTHPLSQIQQSGAQTGQVVKWSGTQWAASDVGWSEIANKPTRFPVAVRKNSGGTDVVRPRINLIEGSNISITVADDSGDDEIDITISATGGATPSNTTPQPTGTAAAGTSTEYSRGDHSHATAILAQGNSQTPVNNEIRFSSNNKLVRWDGSNWVELSVESTTTPVQGTNSYSEVGSQNGEIWYRSNDRAFFFRIGGQRVYPAAAIHTVAESAVGTGAGNRMLLLDSNTNNLLRVGGSVDETVFAFPKLPFVAGNMPVNSLSWGTRGAGTNAAGAKGALWWDTNTDTPRFYRDNSGVAEPFYVYRLRYGSGLDLYGFPTGSPDGMVIVRSGGLFVFQTDNGRVNFIGYEKTFDLVNEGWITDGTSSPSALNIITGGGSVDVRDVYTQFSGFFINRHLVQMGDGTTPVAVILPLGLFAANSSNKTSCTFRVRHQYIRTSGSNPEQWRWEIVFTQLDAGTITRQYRLSPASSTSATQVGQNLFLLYFDLLLNLAGGMEYFENGSLINTTTLPNGLYMVSFVLIRRRDLETAPRSTTQHKVLHIQTSMPINRIALSWT